MASGASALRRMTINRSVIDEAVLALADGLFDTASKIVFSADVPDAPPYGEGLVQGGGVIAYVLGKKVNSTTIGGKQIKPPRAAHVSKQGVVVIGGYGFPARFTELGTLKEHARPFLTPSLQSNIGDTGPAVALAAAKRGLTSASRAAHGDVYGGGK